MDVAVVELKVCTASHRKRTARNRAVDEDCTDGSSVSDVDVRKEVCIALVQFLCTALPELLHRAEPA